MNFRRTPSGLQSVHLFHSVDVVVYCEGGSPHSYEEAIQAAPQHGTLDTFYWRTVAGLIGLKRNYHFISVGSKTTLRSIAEDVDRLNIESVTVCFDRDYEHQIGRQVGPGQRTAHTYGYSWENDVMHPRVLASLLKGLVEEDNRVEHVIAEMHIELNALACALAKWVEIDIALYKKEEKCIISRQNPLSAIDMSAPPKLRISTLEAHLASLGYKRRPKRVVRIEPSAALEVCFGKLVSRALYHYFLKTMLNLGVKTKMEYEIFMRFAIKEFSLIFREGLLPEFAAHLESQSNAFS